MTDIFHDGKVEIWEQCDSPFAYVAGTEPVTIVLDGDNARITVGEGHDRDSVRMTLDGRSGDVLLRGSGGEARVHLVPNGANLWMGGNGQGGDILLFPAEANNLNDTRQANVSLAGSNGNILLKSSSGRTRIQLVPNGANLWIGGNGQGGDIHLFPAEASDNNNPSQANIHLDGSNGDVLLKSSRGRERIHLVPNGANLWIGANGQGGDIYLFPSGATDFHDTSQATIHLDGDTGDITLQNADCAEEFAVLDIDDAEPGTVMVIEDQERLCQSSVAYDKRVAGVISGAGDLRPGIVLGKGSSATVRVPLALSGKVYCKVDARKCPIRIGDLLTTSDTLGHAMRAEDPLKSFGAVIGKALRPMERETGLIPILVALQ
jgi:hypothetical protein